jgi:hypothetical protein
LVFSRQDYLEFGGMQKMPLDINGLLAVPVNLIPYNRAAQEHTVQPDLVRPPGEWMELQERMFFE